MSSRLEAAARESLEAVWGAGPPPASAAAPGRSTLVGEHVDYADGLVVCIAVQLVVAAAVRRSPAGRWRMASGAERLEAAAPAAALGGRDLAGRVLAVVQALREAGVAVPPADVALAADLPRGAGLSSSAALAVSVCLALLRLCGRRLPAAEVAAVALTAERDILGIPVGPLDQRAIVLAPPHGALLLDCRDGGAAALPWPGEEVRLVAVDTGSPHDVGAAGYRTRRAEADGALAALGAGSWRDVDAGTLAAARLPPPLDARARHIVGETARAAAAAEALRRGDAAALGVLMRASHASLRDDYQVSTPALDGAVAAAESVQGCLGARLVGAGFGGTATALVRAAAADRVRDAMRAAAGAGPGAAWVLEPAPGAAARAGDVVG